MNRDRYRIAGRLAVMALSGMMAGLDSHGSNCPVTPREDRLPDIIAPMAGSSPIWLVDGSGGRWSGPNVLVKSAWVLSRRASGDLIVRGRHRDGTGEMRFQVGMDRSPSETGLVVDSMERSVTPGGATPYHMRNYAFVMMYLIYPSPGCWEITARLGEQTRRIVVELRPAAAH